MTSTPVVSIIIAAFNAERYIGAAIESALAQTGAPVEVIVADDASTDNTAGVVDRFTDSRLRLVKLDHNGGPSVARNAAMNIARGAWLAVLDADDRMAHGRIARLLSTAIENDADIVADNMQVEQSGRRRLFIEERLDDGLERITLGDYARHNLLFLPGRGYGYLKPLFRNAFLREQGLAYDPRIRIGEDFHLVAEMLARDAVYLRRRSADYIYVSHEDSISHRLSALNTEAMVEADRRFLAEHAHSLSPDEVKAMRAHLASLEDGAAFARLVDALKCSRWRSAVNEALRRPASIRHLRMPIVARLRRWLPMLGGKG